MSQLLLRLRDKGNTVLVVEHKTAIISIADHVVDIGPGAGDFGGTICFEGSVPELRQSDTLTGRHLADRPRLKEAVRAGSGALTVRHATLHNLADVSVSIPLHALTVITGVAGSGKSSLTAELAGQGQGTVSWSGTREEQSVVVVDHSAITGSSRSTLATYTGVADAIRKAFAQENNVKPALFSSNSEGACPHCAGVGTISTSLGIMSTVTTTCGVCEGKRFDSSVLEYRLRGKSIADVLDLPVSAALEFFHKDRKIRTILSRLDDVGLGYIRLGQTLTTLSGGERQRLKLAVALGQPGEIYIIDEPTNGLHLADVDRLLALLDALVDSGKTVIVVEHHQSVMAHADWIIDCGPGAGRDGGAIVFEGDPRTMVADCHTVTARYLAAALG